MGLDLAQVAGQLPQVASNLQKNFQEREAQLERAVAAFQSRYPNWRPVDCPVAPKDYTAFATDGSQIDVDRHAPVRCYLINIGWVVIAYGAHPGAEIDSKADIHLLGSSDPSTELRTGGERESAEDHETQEYVEQAELSLLRAGRELERLAELLEERQSTQLRLALVDGPLVLRGAIARFLRGKGSEEYLEMVTASLDRIQQQNSHSPTALAGYTSYTSGRDLVDGLNLPNVDLVTDYDIFMKLLSPGQRTGLYPSTSRSLDARWGAERRLQFFYLRTEGEVARVEVPWWIVQEDGLLDATHGAIWDQCRRGLGYPVALSEAHERAVVTVADREAFWGLLHGVLAEESLPDYTSAKSRSKKSRAL